MPVFEPAISADVPELSALLSTLFAQEREFTPNDAAQRRGLSAILGDPACGAILVARENHRVIAMVNLLYTVSTALGERVALLEDMVVAPEARGTGVGSGLLTYAIGFAATHGVRRITLLTDRENLAAHHFYTKHGFTESTMLPFRLAIA